MGAGGVMFFGGKADSKYQTKRIESFVIHRSVKHGHNVYMQGRFQWIYGYSRNYVHLWSGEVNKNSVSILFICPRLRKHEFLSGFCLGIASEAWDPNYGVHFLILVGMKDSRAANT